MIAAIVLALAGAPTARGQDACPSTADCCAPGPAASPGCNCQTCCTCVCNDDPFCCLTDWDQLCVDRANDECLAACPCNGPCPPVACGPDGSGDTCCEVHQIAGCNGLDCCALVCDQDPFCCSTTWDQVCVDEAMNLCPGICSPAPANDACAGKIPIFEGSTPFTNLGASSDGPSPCGALQADVWYTYDATGTGMLSVDTFGSLYDTVVAVYDGCLCIADLACIDTSFCGNLHSCGSGCFCWLTTDQGDVCLPDFSCSLPHCDDFFPPGCPPGSVCVTASCCGVDVCVPLVLCGAAAAAPLGPPGASGLTGTGRFIPEGEAAGDGGVTSGGPTGQLLLCDDDTGGPQSQVIVPVEAGHCYLLQVGGFAGAQGNGTIHVFLDTCQQDVNGDRVVNVDDLVAVILDWSCTGVCEADATMDGIVNVLDLVSVIVHWGPCPAS